MNSDQIRAFRSVLYVPIRGGSMTDGIDALLPVLKLELLLLLGEQAQFDPRIFDELAAFDGAFELGLEQCLAYPVTGSFACGSVLVQLAPIAQGDGENATVPMRPRANVDTGYALPRSSCASRWGRRFPTR